MGNKDGQHVVLAWVMLEVVIASLAGVLGSPLGGGVPPLSPAACLVDSGADVRAGRNPHAVADDGDVCVRRHLVEGVV